jgi:hypothetical protein
MTCADDLEAIAKAQRLPGTHDKELWTGERLVMRLQRAEGNEATNSETLSRD